MQAVERALKDNGHGCGYEFKILWNATSNRIFRLTLVEAQAAGAE